MSVYDKLSELGITVSRRSIARHRAQLGIPERAERQSKVIRTSA